MKNFKILTVATFSLMLLSGCSSNLPKESVPMADGPLSAISPSSSPSNNGSPTTSGSTTPTTSATNNNPDYDVLHATAPAEPTKGDTPVSQSTLLPGIVDNPEQRNQHLVPDPANDSPATTGTGGSGEIIDGTRDSLGAGSKEDKQQAAESYIAFVNLINKKDYKDACEYVKLAPSQGTDCLAAMKKVNIETRIYPVGLKIDRIDNGVITGDTALLNKLVFVYDGDKRIKDVYMSRPNDGSGKWKTSL